MEEFGRRTEILTGQTLEQFPNFFRIWKIFYAAGLKEIVKHLENNWKWRGDCLEEQTICVQGVKNVVFSENVVINYQPLFASFGK